MGITSFPLKTRASIREMDRTAGRGDLRGMQHPGTDSLSFGTEKSVQFKSKMGSSGAVQIVINDLGLKTQI